MTLPASSAYQMSQNASSVNQTELVNTELALVEARISNASTRGLYQIIYSAAKIGNPAGDPNLDNSLTANQIVFRDTLQGVGYKVAQDEASGFWWINWALTGNEASISVYQIETTVLPGSVEEDTITAIDLFFRTLDPSATDRVLIAGSALSGTYIHLVLVQQQTSADHSDDLQTALEATGLGYSSGNTSVSKR
jgi:hypothetical protein